MVLAVSRGLVHRHHVLDSPTCGLRVDISLTAHTVVGLEICTCRGCACCRWCAGEAVRAMQCRSVATTDCCMCCRNKDTEGDAMTKLEQVLNRVQRELGGQVGSFRLKGIRHRFTGRSSLVAFADGMWGGEFALKFYSDVDAAKTEFAIYRQAEVRTQHPARVVSVQP